jgi:hypothetical protein
MLWQDNLGNSTIMKQLLLVLVMVWIMFAAFGMPSLTALRRTTAP